MAMFISIAVQLYGCACSAKQGARDARQSKLVVRRGTLPYELKVYQVLHGCSIMFFVSHGLKGEISTATGMVNRENVRQ